MTNSKTLEPVLQEAIANVAHFVKEVTGIEPTQAEMADAFTRYFVLNEIKDHIVMLREGESG